MADDSTSVEAVRAKDHDYPSYHELSDCIVVQEYKDQFAHVYTTICREGLQGCSNDDIKDKMDVSEEIFKECVENCNPKTLTHDESLIILQKHKRTTLPKDTGLESIDNINNHVDILSSQSSLVWAPGLSPTCPLSSHLVLCPEIILTVLLYHPTLRRPQIEYLVLGCQFLTELKDILYCPRDYNITVDCSDNPKSVSDFDNKFPPNPSKSGYFFINNTFYNDMRDFEGEDYSSNIIDWVNSSTDRRIKSSRLHNFTKADMKSTKFEQLSIRLGYPYLYCHHGNCEHGIVFTDMRLFNPSDIQDRQMYPILNQYWKSFRKRCCVCVEFTACWVTVGDDLAPESPAFFCKTCFTMLHYTKDGDKMTQFTAYPYYDEMTSLLGANTHRLNNIS